MTSTAHHITDFEHMRTQTSYCYYVQDKSRQGEINILGKLNPEEWFSYQLLLRDLNNNFGDMLPTGNYRLAIVASPAAYPTLKSGLPDPMNNAVIPSGRLQGHEFVVVYMLDD